MGLIRTISIQRCIEEHTSVCGGKAWALAQMMQWDLPVPEGFVLLFSDKPVASLCVEEKTSIGDAYRELSDREGTENPAVAVRSSASGEDSSDSSFAGQYETFLNVRGLDALFESVQKCLCARSSERVRAYRRSSEGSLGAMGVVVQLMVPAKYAGVCSSRSPGKGDEVIVEIVEGLGESLVSGKETPARISLNRDLSVISQNDDRGFIKGFGLENVISVARLTLQAEERFDSPQDVEWAYAGKRVFLLQARPITTIDTDHKREKIRDREIERLKVADNFLS